MIEIAFTGDIMLSRRVGERIKNELPILSKEVISCLRKHDFVVGNLECPVTTVAQPLSKNGFRAEPSTLQQVQIFDLFSIANNHIFDCGKSGAGETINYLNRNNKTFCGTIEENGKSFFTKEIKGKHFGFISCAVDECIKNESDQKPNIVRALDGELTNLIQDLKDRVDYVIMLVHGGNEMIPYPEPSFRTLCRKFIDSGASTVITHHPHVLGGMETYKGRKIFYSLGDFIFDGESFRRRKGSILSLKFSNDKIDWVLIPTKIEQDLTVKLADKKLSSQIHNDWTYISNSLKKSDYNRKYKILYIKSLTLFQIDRLKYLVRSKGLLYSLKFMIKKAALLPFYIKKLLNKGIN